MPRADFCVAIPALNEEKVIDSSICALKRIVRKEHIYVVSDGSTDRTASLAKSQNVNVLSLTGRVGKARALDRLIKSKKLLERYRYILFSDADSRLSSNFYEEIKKFIDLKPACIVGTVTSDRKGLVSAFRTYEYSFTHRVFKNAQDKMGTILVAPGCASLYRSDVLSNLDFSGRTLTEDFDLTLQIHTKKLGKVIYAPKAKVVTQDPLTLRDYCRQVLRWYTGFWQNVVLHKLYRSYSRIGLELYIMLSDYIALALSIALIIVYPQMVLRVLLWMYVSLIITSSIMISLERQFWAMLYIPLFPLLYLINLSMNLLGFFRSVFAKKELDWQSVTRYQVDT
ncbi:MAG: glycosyltransferase [bacterium]|nr:glycosyltransferase [bacterium]